MTMIFSVSLGRVLSARLTEHLETQDMSRNAWVKEAVAEKLERELAQIDIADKESK